MNQMNINDLVQEGTVSGKIYTEPGIFEMEMNEIYAKSWLYVAHESEIAKPGDYKTTHMGHQPVIVTKGVDDEEIYVFYNRCRHRAATVCQQEYGNASYFRCAYHGWTYSNDGRLTGCPLKKGYGEEFDASEMGLIRVPRVANYRGFIFACHDSEVENLEDFLGHAREYLDYVVDSGPEGIELSAGVQKYVYDGNWKLHMENTIDAYHFSVVHRSHEMLAQKRGEKVIKVSERSKIEKVYELGNGHSAYQAGGNVGIGALPFNLIIFPNLAFVGSHLRYLKPITENRTEVYMYPIMEKGAPTEKNRERLRKHERFYGPASFGSPDDIEVGFRRVTEGLKAKGDDQLIFTRGMHVDEFDEKGIRIGRTASDEGSPRTFYRQWKQLMTKS